MHQLCLVCSYLLTIIINNIIGCFPTDTSSLQEACTPEIPTCICACKFVHVVVLCNSHLLLVSSISLVSINLLSNNVDSVLIVIF